MDVVMMIANLGVWNYPHTEYTRIKSVKGETFLSLESNLSESGTYEGAEGCKEYGNKHWSEYCFMQYYEALAKESVTIDIVNGTL